MTTYTVGEMAEKLKKSIRTLQQWDRDGVLKAHRTPTNRRYYTHEQYIEMINKKEKTNSIIDDGVVLITGSGTLATQAVEDFKDRCKKIIIYSRGEDKQRKLRDRFSKYTNIRYIIGDILDKNALMFAMRDVDVVLHTAALKMIETGFYSSDQVVRTNTIGTMNVAEVAIERGVKKALFISSDKASSPLNGLTYGLSKALAETVWLSYNNRSTRGGTILFASRYGNILNSNNSFYDILEEQKRNGIIKITDINMTRFYFTIQMAMKLNIYAIDSAERGGEIFIPKIKSASIKDFLNAFAKGFKYEIIGVRGVEKLAEELISEQEMKHTYLCKDKDGTEYYKIINDYIKTPNMGWDLCIPEEKPVKPFKYTSDSDDVERLTENDLRTMIFGKENKQNIIMPIQDGKIL